MSFSKIIQTPIQLFIRFLFIFSLLSILVSSSFIGKKDNKESMPELSPPLPRIKVTPSYPPEELGSTFQAFLETECATNGVPYLLACKLISIESQWHQSACHPNIVDGEVVSTDYGIMQLNSIYIKPMINANKDRHRYIEDYDIIGSKFDNVQIGVRHLADLYKTLRSWRKAVMAYNCGLPSVMINRIPPTTQIYVDLICPYEGWWKDYQKNSPIQNKND